MSEKFCNECGLPFAEREELHGRIVLARKEAEAAGSLMLDVQQDSIVLRTDREALVRYVRANNEFYGRWPAQIRSAWEELPEELREEISE